MDSNGLIWGIIVLATGIFVCAYGNILFRFVLAFIGFAIGYSLVMWLGGSLSDALQIVVGLVVGGIFAAIFYSVFRFALYIAGGLLGLVIMLGILGLFKLGGMGLNSVVGWILVVAAAGLGAFFGNRLGDMVLVLATALAGAYFVVLGLGALFSLDVETGNPLAMLGAGFTLVLFLTIALISGLAQYQAFSFRRRVLH